ncbi:hypothetical protein D3C73_1605390 [compost metagenome]
MATSPYPAYGLDHLNHIIIMGLTATQCFIEVVLRYGKAQMIECILHAAIVNGMAEIFDDIQRHIPSGTN